MLTLWPRIPQSQRDCVMKPRVARSSQPWALGRNPFGILGTNFRKALWLALTAGVLSLILSLAAAPVASPPSSTSQILEALRKKHDLPALAVVVVKDGKICDRAATGVRKRGDPTRVTTNDIFHIGSCTKSMTATLVAMFVEEGRLRW